MKRQTWLFFMLILLVVTTFTSCIVRVHDRDYRYHNERRYQHRHYHERYDWRY